jgi:ubiquinone/menaquinone biosynthesis C-methylase UbiE
MPDTSIQFDDGAAYERYMGKWSQLVADEFLNWLAPASGLRWLDIGCGNGAFTEIIVARCAPSAVDGIDPSEGQLAFARQRPAARVATFQQGDAMALPFADNTFDVAVMPLVIFFVPEPPKGVTEMARVVRPGGIVSAYAWDMPGGGFPYQALHDEMRALSVEIPSAPHNDVSRIEARQITVERTFADFDDYWSTIRGGPSVGRKLAAMKPEDLAILSARMRVRLPHDPTGRITYTARANAIQGRVQT